MRRGFGSTVIERSIPFELGGTAEVAFALTGLKARFMIPAIHIESFDATTAPQLPMPGTAARQKTEAHHPVSGKALLLEDNMIIAMDGEHFLKEIGAVDVLVASTVKEALRMIDEHAPDFAVLDVNLGGENSLPVAERLTELGKPFVFATGYGETSGLLADFKDAPIVTKPFSQASLTAGLQKALQKAD
ncbi:MAG: response regulator [Neomegalonema sp.]|nr:response regulator [Neomegalonema sp.]